MSEHLDNLSFADRRVGSDAVLLARADIEIGWAYRLIAVRHDAQAHLRAGLPGRSALERAGIPEPSIATIATAFMQEQAGGRRSHFEKALVADTLINHERATAQLMRAKADMLLPASSRYPEVEGSDVAELLAGDDATAVRKGAPTTAEPLTGWSAFSEQAPSSAPAEEATPPPPLPKGIPLPITEFMKRRDKLIDSKRNWERKTAQDVRVVVEAFAGIHGEHGVKTFAEITQFHMGRLCVHFDEIPTTYCQRSRLHRLSHRESP